MPARTWLVLGLSICFCEFPCSAQRSNPFGSHGGFGRADVPWDLRRWPGRLFSHLHNGLVRLYRDLLFDSEAQVLLHRALRFDSHG